MGAMARRCTLLLGCQMFALLALNTCRTCHGVIPYQCQGKIDLTFVMDQSESIRENDPLNRPDHNWNLLKGFVKGVTKDLPIGADTHVAMVKYSTAAQLMWPLGKYTYAYDLEQAVDALEHQGGNTNTAEALQHVREVVYVQGAGDRADARNVVVLMTDGLSTVRSADLLEEARLTRAEGADIYVVSVGSYTDEMELRDIVDDFSKNIVNAENFERLAAIQELLVHRVCGLPDPQPGDKPPTDCQKMDLAFIVDNSGSIRDKGEQNYGLLKNFLTNMVDQLDIGVDKTRVGTVRFSDVAELEFNLNTYYDKELMKQKLNAMPFRGSHTNTSGAIRLAMSELFNNNPKFGDRPGVPNIGIIITDGESTREKNNTIPEAVQAKNRGVQLFVIGVTEEINEVELKGIVSPPINEHYFEATKIRYLNSILYNVLKNVCNALK